MSVFVRFWGTRGSIPTPGNKTRRYGGNTSCVEVEANNTLFIADAGTGLRELGLDLQNRRSGPVEAHLLFSHTHWDHIQGFPFFLPAYQATTRMHVYEISRSDDRFAKLLLGQMRSEYFPVAFSDLGGSIVPQHFTHGRTEVANVRLQTLEQTHPGRSFAYRFETQGQCVVYATDNELDLALQNAEEVSRDPEVPRQCPEEYLRFIAESDLLIADAQYTDEEYPKKVGWGHSRVNTIVDAAVQAGVRQLALYHHDPLHSDDQVDAILEAARKRVALRGSSLSVFAAREGLVLRIG